MRSSVTWLVAALLVGLSISSPAAAEEPSRPPEASAANPDNDRKARELFERGVELSKQERWAEAEAMFSASAELVPSPHCLLNLAVMRFRMKRPRSGLEAISRLEALGSQVSEAQTMHARAIRTRLELQLARRVLQVTPAFAELRINGELVQGTKYPHTLELDPGSYTISLSAKGYVTNTREIQVEAGSSGEVDVTLAASPTTTGAPLVGPREPRSANPLATKATPLKQDASPRDSERSIWKSPWLWVGVGVVAAGAGVSIYALTRDTEASEVQASERPVITFP